MLGLSLGYALTMGTMALCGSMLPFFLGNAERASTPGGMVVILGILVIGAVSLLLFKFIGTEFFPEQDEGQFTVTVKLPVGTRIEESTLVCEEIEKVLQSNIP